MSTSLPDEKFAALGTPRRVWAIGSALGDAARLRLLHDHLIERVRPQDRVVYLGDYVGPHGGLDAVEEVLMFRRMLLMRPGMEASDFIYLRGLSEYAWQRLLRLPFAPDPERLLQRLLDDGADHYIAAYGGDHGEGLRAARSGVPALTRWINNLRTLQRRWAGHETLFTAMRRAAYSWGPAPLLFVPCGFDPSRKLADQDDMLWAGISGFGRIAAPCQGYMRITRGRELGGLGFDLRDYSLTLDPADGRGPLFCAAILANAQVGEVLRVDPLRSTDAQDSNTPRFHRDTAIGQIAVY